MVQRLTWILYVRLTWIPYVRLTWILYVRLTWILYVRVATQDMIQPVQNRQSLLHISQCQSGPYKASGLSHVASWHAPLMVSCLACMHP